MWATFQLCIVVAVVFSNIAWQWTPNPLLAGLAGVGLAFLVTFFWTNRGNVWGAIVKDTPLDRKPDQSRKL